MWHIDLPHVKLKKNLKRLSRRKEWLDVNLRLLIIITVGAYAFNFYFFFIKHVFWKLKVKVRTKFIFGEIM